MLREIARFPWPPQPRREYASGGEPSRYVRFVEPLAPDDPMQVGPIRLHGRLGAGGMGRVYLGYTDGARAVAVKVVHPELARDPEFMQRFRREVNAARAVSGAFTAPVVDAGPDDSPPWLATAYVAGPTLAQAVAGTGPLPEAAVWRLAGGLVEALRAVHGCGLVHRDLKPGNILLAVDGPRVIDFGIALALEGTVMTAAGTTIGTPAFMSPEQARGREAGPASDVFSLGSVLAFAATGTAPFDGGAVAAILYKVMNAEPNLTRVPPGLRALAAACLTKDPAARPTLAQLIEAVKSATPFPQDAAPGRFWPGAVGAFVESWQPGSAAPAAHPATGTAHPGTVSGRAGPPPSPAAAGETPASRGQASRRSPSWELVKVETRNGGLHIGPLTYSLQSIARIWAVPTRQKIPPRAIRAANGLAVFAIMAVLVVAFRLYDRTPDNLSSTAVEWFTAVKWFVIVSIPLVLIREGWVLIELTPGSRKKYSRLFIEVGGTTRGELTCDDRGQVDQIIRETKRAKDNPQAEFKTVVKNYHLNSG